jgi:hypothetical protein
VQQRLNIECGRFIVASLLCGAVLFAVGLAFHFLMPVLAPWLEVEYRNDALFRPWDEWTRYYMLAHPWLFGFLFSCGFFGARAIIGRSKLSGVHAGVLYGLAIFVIGSLPVYALNLASFQVSVGVIVAWALQSVAQYLSAGIALGVYCARASSCRE